MEPIALTIRGERRWMLIHRCTRCGRLRMNRTAADDNVLLLMQLAALPLAAPPFPHPGPAPLRAPGAPRGAAAGEVVTPPGTGLP
jgi:RNHCP domain